MARSPTAGSLAIARLPGRENIRDYLKTRGKCDFWDVCGCEAAAHIPKIAFSLLATDWSLWNLSDWIADGNTAACP
jgi:hypothetical protein